MFFFSSGNTAVPNVGKRAGRYINDKPADLLFYSRAAYRSLGDDQGKPCAEQPCHKKFTTDVNVYSMFEIKIHGTKLL